MEEVENIIAPVNGTVVAILVEQGELVGKGQPLVIVEAMKMQTTVVASKAGVIKTIAVPISAHVEEQTLLVIIQISGENADAAVAPAIINPNTSLQDALIKRISQTTDEVRIKQASKRADKGYLTARRNLALLCEPDTFVEYGQLAVAAQRKRRSYQDLQQETAADGVITGVGSVVTHEQSQQCCDTAIVINDYSVLAGTQGYFHHLKLDRILHIAESKKLPVIMYTEGGGGRPGDTDITTVNSGLQCQSFATWARLSGKIPRITVANGYCFAGNAALFGAGDITIATKQSWIGMAGPAMIEGGGLGVFKPTDIGPIDVQRKNGVVDIVADNEIEAASLAKRCLSYFVGRVEKWKSPEQSLLSSIMPDDRRYVYDVRKIINTLADTDSVMELKSTFGGAIITCFIRLAGRPIGLIASDCRVLGGAIDVDAAEKAADFLTLCELFDLPIVSLCDTPGFMVGPEHEKRAAVRKLNRLFTVGSKLSVPMASVILRKCYGLGAQAMLGGSTLAADYCFSWPNGEFGPMGLEGAVKLGFKKELEAISDKDERQKRFDELVVAQYQNGQAIEVASTLEIDAVIEPQHTRQTLIQMLGQK